MTDICILIFLYVYPLRINNALRMIGYYYKTSWRSMVFRFIEFEMVTFLVQIIFSRPIIIQGDLQKDFTTLKAYRNVFR